MDGQTGVWWWFRCVGFGKFCAFEAWVRSRAAPALTVIWRFGLLVRVAWGAPPARDRMMRIWKGLAFGFGEPAAIAWVADSWFTAITGWE